MMLKVYRFFSTLFFLFLIWKSSAQISGSYTVPGSYVSLASAINALNSQAIVGATTIHVAAGYTETVPNGGYTLTATGTSINPIYFKKLGTGANPLLLAYTGGTATPSSIKQDGIWVLAGSDYITIDGFTLKDANTTNPATMEYGIRMVRFNPNNGCQYNTIQNCYISLTTVNAASPGFYNAAGSRGIEISSESIVGMPTATSIAGANSFNKFYSNIIKRCNVGIALHGDSTLILMYNDSNNDIGGSTLFTGNSVTKFGTEQLANNPTAIYLSNQLNANVSYNYVNNDTIAGQNNFADMYGVYMLNDPGSSCTINSNTVSLSTGTTVVVGVHPILRSAAFLANASGTVTISDNFISGCTIASPSSSFSCIENSAKASQLNVSGNVFTNIKKGGGNQAFYNFRNTGNIMASLTVSNNVISNQTVSIVGALDGYHGIYSLGSSSLCAMSIYSNSIQSTTLTGTGYGPFHFIYCDGTVAVSAIESNSVSNIVINSSNFNAPIIHSGGATGSSSIINNAIQNVTVGTSYSPTGFTMIDENSTSASGSVTVSGNLIKNIWTDNVGFSGIIVSSPKKVSIASNTLSAITVSTASQSYGIFAVATSTSAGITNNLVENISGVMVWGIISNNSITGVIQSNTVHALSGQSGSVFGITVGGKRPKVLNNKLYDLATYGFGGVAGGISAVVHLDTAFISNNLIGDLRAPNSYGPEQVRGIDIYSIADTGYFKVSYNSIYLNASSTAALFGSSGITHYATVIPTQGRLFLNNNIIVNNSVANGGEFTAALRRTGGSSGNYDPSSNNNLFYAGPTSTANALYVTGVTYTTLASMKIALSPRESASVKELPPFLTTNGSNPFYLKLNPLLPTQAESGGQPLQGIPFDYAGTLRNTSTPDIGAWEGSYTSLDITAPLINAMAPGGCNLSSITLTASLVDASGVASGSLAPKCYFKINSGPYSSVQGTLSSGNSNNGIWNFPLSYLAVPGNTLYYYFVAQDVNLPLNIDALPASGFSGTSVNNVTTPPANPFSILIGGVLNGTYTVGSAGNFTTLSAAANAYNTWCLTGPVTFVLTDPLYSVSENFPITFLNNQAASNSNSLLIIPSPSIQVVVTNLNTSDAVFKFSGARYIKMDGLNTANSSISVNNNNPLNSTAIWLTSQNTPLSANKCLSFYNLQITGAGNTSNNYGLLAGAKTSVPTFTPGYYNDSIDIVSNTFLKTYHAIAAIGNTLSSNGALYKWRITDNVIGPATNGSNNIGGCGVMLYNANSANIARNVIRNIQATAGNIFGIWLNGGQNSSCNSNTLTSLSSSASTNYTTSLTGITVSGTLTNQKVESNFISGMNSSNISSGPCGIYLLQEGGTSNRIINNMISDISGMGTSAGLFAVVYTGTCEVDHNSVCLSGNYPGANGVFVAIACEIVATNGSLKVRNNIFHNSYNNINSSSDQNYALYTIGNPTNFPVFDYNDYSLGGSASSLMLAYANNANQNSLPALQSSLGGNLNSKTITPVFVSAQDPHLQPLANAALDNLGMALPIVNTDIDGQSRSSISPDMGADEFFAFNCSSATASLTTSSASVCSGNSFTFSANTPGGNGMSYQWQYSTTPGGPYVNVTSGSGAQSTVYSGSASSTYYYILQSTCALSSATAATAEATLVVNAVPTASFSSNIPLCSGQTLSLNTTSVSGVNYNWTGPASFTASGASAIITGVSAANNGVYTLAVSQGSCSSTYTSAISIINATTIASNNGPYCTGYNVQLNAPAANSYTWTGPGSFASNMQSPSFTASTPTVSGTYSLVADLGVCFATSTVNVLVNSAPNASAASTGTACPGNSVMLSAAGGTTYVWSGPAAFQATVQNVTLNNIQASTAGIYTVVVSDPFMCSASATAAVVVYSNPTIVTAINNASICAGQTNTITASGAASYTWNTGPNSSSITVSPLVSTVYTVTGTNTLGCSATQTAFVIVNQLPNISISGNTNLCSGQSSTLTGSGAATYTWNSSAVTNSIAISPTVNTSYTLASTSIAGCLSTTTIPITVNPLPTVSVVSSNSILCAGQPAVLSASGATSYTWSSSATGSTLAVTPSVTTSYTVWGTGANNCSDYMVYTQMVTVCTLTEETTLSQDVLMIYPNPNTGEFVLFINNHQGEILEAEVFDMAGKLIFKDKTKALQNFIQISCAPVEGVYLIKTSFADGTYASKRLVIIK